jgi:antitoxin component of MazEF toxin-antitoxin module
LADGKKVIVEQVTIRAARSGKNPPLIVSIPRSIADKAKLQIGDTMLMFTDGDKVIITRPEMPKV